MKLDKETREVSQMLMEQARDEMCEKISERMRDTAYSTSSDSYLVKSLVDRGLADSRALPIANALRDGDMRALAFAVCSCDEWNFPHLLKIEPRIFWMLLVNETDPVLIQRLEEVMK
jgi:hypothetical protein